MMHRADSGGRGICFVSRQKDGVRLHPAEPVLPPLPHLFPNTTSKLGQVPVRALFTKKPPSRAAVCLRNQSVALPLRAQGIPAPSLLQNLMTLCRQGHKIHLFDFILRLSLSLTRGKKTPNQPKHKVSEIKIIPKGTEFAGREISLPFPPAWSYGCREPGGRGTVSCHCKRWKSSWAGSCLSREDGQQGLCRPLWGSRNGQTEGDCNPLLDGSSLRLQPRGHGGRSLSSSHCFVVGFFFLIFTHSFTPF